MWPRPPRGQAGGEGQAGARERALASPGRPGWTRRRPPVDHRAVYKAPPGAPGSVAAAGAGGRPAPGHPEPLDGGAEEPLAPAATVSRTLRAWRSVLVNPGCTTMLLAGSPAARNRRSSSSVKWTRRPAWTARRPARDRSVRGGGVVGVERPPGEPAEEREKAMVDRLLAATKVSPQVRRRTDWRLFRSWRQRDLKPGTRPSPLPQRA